nr:reverse transcriptase domain-containing protein [Tanacetum cinerariifolium]
MANTTPLLTTVTKPAINPVEANSAPRVNIQEFCEEHYEDILPIIMEKVRHDRRKNVHTRLDFGEGPKERIREDSYYSNTRARATEPERVKVQDRLKYDKRFDFRIFEFIRGEAAAASKKKGHVSWKPQDESKRHSVDKRPAEEADRRISASRKTLASNYEIKQGRDQSKVGKKETAVKDKPTAIYMVQSWQRTVKQKVTQSFERVGEIAFLQLAASNGTEGPLVIEAEMGGHMIHRMYIDGGSSKEILYEHCFNRLRLEIKNQMVPAITSLTGFSGETIWPLGQTKLLMTIGDATHSTKSWMNFTVVKSMSPYNGIIGRPGLKAIQAVPSTVHGMLKFPVEGGIATIRSTILIPTECASVTTSSVIPKEERTCPANFKVALHPDFPDQEVVIGGSLSDKGHTELCSVLKKNLDIFAWQPSDMTGVPRSVAEHRLNIREGYSPLAEADEEKTAFHAGQGVYCYTKMPFGLKNAGATYQRLMDKAFEGQMGRNIEVYVDDLVVKSHTEAEIVRDIEETFRTLRKVNMKLNPQKCSFGLAEGVFLGIPGEIISDNGKQFSDNPFKDWCDKLNITQRFASVKHPQSNGLVERANRRLGEGIKSRLGDGNKNWVEELPHVLWAHRTMIKSSHGDTPFSLTYGTKAVIPTEIGMPTYRTAAVNVVNNDEELRLNLDLLEECRERAAICEAKSKSKMMKYYNARVRDVAFRPGDFVYRSNDTSHAVAGGKLGPKWEGPYELTEALGNGAYKLRSMDGTILPRTWNVANLKRCYL